jgi:hypothetical protein
MARSDDGRRPAVSTLMLPRTLRLDPSDAFVFETAADAGEWAVAGAFLFWDRDVEALTAKERVAFRSGFVGVRSLGFSTLVVVAEASEAERDEAVEDLARHILERFGAPGIDAARAAAREEIDGAASLCCPGIGAVVAMRRSFEDGEIREAFRTLRPRPPGEDPLHSGMRAFVLVETDGDEDEEPAERVDLASLRDGRS